MSDKEVMPKTNGGELSLIGLRNNLVGYRQSMPSSANGITGFMKMDRNGVWVYGADATAADLASVWLINPHTFGHGWIAWNDGAVENEVYKLLSHPLPSPASLEPVDAEDGWQEERGLVMVCIRGADKGEQVTFKTNSRGGIEAVATIADKIIEEMDGGSRAIFPQVLLRTTSYKHKKYGKIFKPIFEIVGWSSNEPRPEPEPEPTPEPPRKRAVKVPEPAVEEPDDDPEPQDRQVTGRRRRTPALT